MWSQEKNKSPWGLKHKQKSDAAWHLTVHFLAPCDGPLDHVMAHFVMFIGKASVKGAPDLVNTAWWSASKIYSCENLVEHVATRWKTTTHSINKWWFWTLPFHVRRCDSISWRFWCPHRNCLDLLREALVKSPKVQGWPPRHAKSRLWFHPWPLT